MAEEPIIAQKGPYVLEMEPGTYFWCACGRSNRQPFCDQSHRGTGLGSVKVEITEKKAVEFCGCKQSGSAPFCDDTHKNV